MKLVLDKKPKNATIIEGFPGFGLIATIATEYLINHLDAVQIGKIVMEEVPPIVAIHSGQVIEPVGIFYSKKHNLVILHVLSAVTGYEWQMASMIEELSKQLSAKEIICIEGVGSVSGESNVYFVSEKNAKKFKNKAKIDKLTEGIVMGVTGSLILNKKLPVSCIFAETLSNLPDSRGASKIIEVLDRYLGLKVDPKPLLKKAKQFETKINDLLKQGKQATVQKQRKELSYLG
jgi:uncharacterized protein